MVLVKLKAYQRPALWPSNAANPRCYKHLEGPGSVSATLLRSTPKLVQRKLQNPTTLGEREQCDTKHNRRYRTALNEGVHNLVEAIIASIIGVFRYA